MKKTLIYMMAATAIALSACSGLTTSKAPPETVYNLRAAKAAPVTELAMGQSYPVLSIPAPAVPPGYDTARIALQINDGRQLDYFAAAKWPATLDALLQNVAIETGRETLRRVTISNPDLRLPADYKLAITVLDFQPFYRGAPESNPDLVVSLNFRLIRSGGEDLVLDFTLGRTAPAVPNTLTDITAGLENALQIILAEAFAEIDRAIVASVPGREAVH